RARRRRRHGVARRGASARAHARHGSALRDPRGGGRRAGRAGLARRAGRAARGTDPRRRAVRPRVLRARACGSGEVRRSRNRICSESACRSKGSEQDGQQQGGGKTVPRKKWWGIAALTVMVALVAAGCGSSNKSSSSTSAGASTSSGSSSAKGSIAVLLPDTQSSVRWEQFDRKYLDQAFTAAGIKHTITNAQGDPGTQRTQAEQALTNGAKVILLVDLDPGSGKSIISLAHARGAKVIDYDRLTLGG